MNRLFAHLLIVWFFAMIGPLHAQEGGTVKIIRDQWGVPHIYAEDDWSLFYGAGYAAAQDRLLQMNIARLSVQGRMSEVFGQQYLAHDRRLRTLGLYLHAQRSLSQFPDTVRLPFEAYAAGVNAYMADNPGHLADVFQNLNLQPESWKAEDGVACFLRISEYFDRGWTGEVQSLRKFELLADSLGREEAIRQLESQRKNIDDEVPIVSREEYDRYEDQLAALGSEPSAVATTSLAKGGDSGEGTWQPPKMSHDWVVSGSKSSTGLPILESDPQIAVESPSTWYEFHLSGGRFNVRGISVPGTPAMLIGFSENCAWGLTALGSDNADLFLEQLKSGSTTEYVWKGGYENIDERTETIKVRGRSDEEISIRSTRHGPIVNEFVTGERPDEVFALHWLVTDETATSAVALLEMMAATSWPTFVDGMRKYRSPGVHLIYADKSDNIAYYTLARVPLRVHHAGIPFLGWLGDEEWLGTVPFDEMPRMLNPTDGFISTANNLPIGSWYPYFIGGGIGDNARSWRLRELMSGTDTFTPDDFFDVHRDAVNPIIRDFVRFALMAVEARQPSDPDVLAAADILKDWDYKLLTSSSTYRMTSTIGTTIKRSLRGTPLEDRYLGSDAGLAQLFRDLEAYHDSTGQLNPDPDILDWLLAQLGEVYRKSGISGNGRPVVVTHAMPYQDNLENLGSLSSRYDLTSPPLHTSVVATIWSQLGNSYSQIVNYAQIDSSYSVLPPGNSELPTGGHFNDQVSLWVDGDMHLAPLSRASVERIRETEYTLHTGQTIIETDVRPASFRLLNVYPNPFARYAIFEYEIASSSSVSLEIFSPLGRRLRQIDLGHRTSGRHLAVLNSQSDGNKALSPGTYLYRLHAGTHAVTGIIMKFK